MSQQNDDEFRKRAFDQLVTERDQLLQKTDFQRKAIEDMKLKTKSLETELSRVNQLYSDLTLQKVALSQENEHLKKLVAECEPFRNKVQQAEQVISNITILKRSENQKLRLSTSQIVEQLNQLKFSFYENVGKHQSFIVKQSTKVFENHPSLEISLQLPDNLVDLEIQQKLIGTEQGQILEVQGFGKVLDKDNKAQWKYVVYLQNVRLQKAVREQNIQVQIRDKLALIYIDLIP